MYNRKQHLLPHYTAITSLRWCRSLPQFEALPRQVLPVQRQVSGFFVLCERSRVFLARAASVQLPLHADKKVDRQLEARPAIVQSAPGWLNVEG